MDAQAFLDKAAKAKRQPVYALVGEEDFLKRRVRDAIITSILGDADPAFAVSAFPGEKLDFSTVRNELETLPFLAPCRIVVIDNADTKGPGGAEPFLSRNRPALEQYVAKPSAVGVLILDVKSFPETTKLAKALPDAAKIVCKAPREDGLPAWCVGWAKSQYGKSLTRDAAEELVERVGAAMGLLDQELGKLAVAVGTKAAIGPDDVDRLVGRSKESNVFLILDAIGSGQPGEALSILERLLDEGEHPLAILGALTHTLRKLAAVAMLLDRGQSIGMAMDAAGVPSWPKARQGMERQVKWLGKKRLEMLPEWLVELNYGIKGGNPLPERVQPERLVVKLARPAVSTPGRPAAPRARD
jgi:DNA polymerase-3 subunit delta